MCPQEWWWLYEANVGLELKDALEAKERVKRLYKESKTKEQSQ